MGRGGARAKTSGGTLSGEGPLTEQTLSLNLTLFQFLQTGYFEKDVLSYCANRLAQYSCIYWLDPTVDDATEGVELHTAAYQTESMGWTTPSDVEFTKYPSHFINQDRGRPTGATLVQTLTEGQPITGTFLGPVNVREVLLSDQGTSLAVVESNRLPLDAAARVILPFLLLLACLANLFVLRATYKLSLRRLPLAIYFVYIALFDQLDLMARGTDYLVEAYGGIRLFTAIQFLGRSACQLLPMIHSGLRHVHASLLIGFAIDTWRFSSNPLLFTAVYRREWTRNVLILASVLAIIVDSQFLWTFDLSQLETKTIHERLVRNAYECGFSATTTLSPLFLYIIWPMIDHFWTELIPCFVCGTLGTLTLIMLHLKRRRQPSTTAEAGLMSHEKDVDSTKTSPVHFQTVVYRWLDGHTMHEAPSAFAQVVIVDSIFIVPRAIYYLTKYALFNNCHMNRVGAVYLGYESQTEHPTLVAIGNSMRRVARLRQYEAQLEGVEAVMRYVGCLYIVVRSAVLVHNLTELRKMLAIYWRAFRRRLSRNICCSQRCVIGRKKRGPHGTLLESVQSNEIDRTEGTFVSTKNNTSNKLGKTKRVRTDGDIIRVSGAKQQHRSRSGTRKRDGPASGTQHTKLFTTTKHTTRARTVPIPDSTELQEDRTTIQLQPRAGKTSQRPNQLVDALKPTKQIYTL